MGKEESGRMLQGDWGLELYFRSPPQHAIFSHHIVRGQHLGLSLGDEGAEISDDAADTQRMRSRAAEWPSGHHSLKKAPHASAATLGSSCSWGVCVSALSAVSSHEMISVDQALP